MAACRPKIDGSHKSPPVILLGFDGSPVYDDTAVLNRWLDVAEKDKNSRVLPVLQHTSTA